MGAARANREQRSMLGGGDEVGGWRCGRHAVGVLYYVVSFLL